VQFVPGLARPFVMLYSRGQGLGEQAHIGHAIRRADSVTPDGPFVDSGHLLTPDLDFAIDPDVYRLRDGVLRLAFATDFVDEPPLGTGIVEASVRDDLTELLTQPQVILRAHDEWQLYDPARKMPWKTIPGVDWQTDTVRWYTVEAPVGGLVSPRGEDVYLYSGGCYFAYYAVGAVVKPQAPAGGEGPADVTGKPGDSPRDHPAGIQVLRPQPEQGFYAPGHCSLVTGPGASADASPDTSPGASAGEQRYLLFHARYGSQSAPRQMSLAPLLWNEAGLPYCPQP
jgi:hypothetical protein